MKIGLKFFPNNRDYLKRLLPKAGVDFIELMAIQGEDFGLFGKLGIPVNLHCEHQDFGVNFANPEKEKVNAAALNFALGLADKLGSRYIVVHPGYMENKRCSFAENIRFLNGFNDKRILIENLPHFSGKRKGTKKLFMGNSPEEIKDIMKGTGVGFCLDFGHAAVAAHRNGTDYIKTAHRFMKLKPAYFHISDNDLSRDTHKNLGDGSLDIEAFCRMIRGKKNLWVAIETVHFTKKQINDVNVLRELL